jgi:hypothetical protein
MKFRSIAASLALALSLSAISPAQNVPDTKATKQQLKAEDRANEAQAKADKAERKALNTKQQKKADKAQDDANRKAAPASPPQ